MPDETNPKSLRPDICIGTDEILTPKPLAAFAERCFADADHTVAFNTPFTGSFVPGRFYRKDNRVSSIMVEIKRSVYMDEEGGDKLEGFKRLKSLMNKFIRELA